MTCIVGLVHEDKVYIGGDSAGVDDRYGLTVRTDRKVFRNEDFIMGFTTSFRMGQLLAYALKPPRRHPADDIFAYMVKDFVNAVRECLKSGGFAEKHNDAERGGAFLIGHEGRLFCIQGDYQVEECAYGFNAVGCGSAIALGALAVSGHEEPNKRVIGALTAAERFSAGVRAPFHLEVIPSPSSTQQETKP